MPRVSEQHREERRRQIMDGARRAFAEHGYFGTNVARLEQAIGLSRGAIFSYYPSKLELFTALAQEDRGALGELWLKEGFEGVIRESAAPDSHWAGVYLDASRLLRSDPELRERWDAMTPEVFQRLEQQVSEQRDAGEIRSDLPLDTVGRFLGIFVDGLALQVGAGYVTDLDVEGLIELVRSAVKPQ